MTDRSLRADQLAHARRTNPQTDDARLAEIRDQIRLACAKDAGFTRVTIADMEPHDYQVGADTIIAEVVQPLLARGDRAEATVERMKRTNRMANKGAQEVRERAEAAEAKVRAVETIRVWRNEDGKRFMFADEVAVALGIVTQEQADAIAAKEAPNA